MNLSPTPGSSKDDENISSNFKRTGSLRKVLPAEHIVEPEILVHDIETEKLLKIFQREYIILAEYKMLQTEKIPGVYVIPSYANSFLWFGVIFVRSGCYENGIFRFTITLPESFPDSIPIVEFQTKVFHPLIDEQTYQLNLNGGFRSWTRGEDHIWQLLKYIIYVFLDLRHSVKFTTNENAARLLRDDNAEFKSIVSKCVSESQLRIYDEPSTDDLHYFKFRQYDDDTFREAFAKLKRTGLRDNDNGFKSPGYSWVKDSCNRHDS